jgi:Xaa-Pro aminopeptidase
MESKLAGVRADMKEKDADYHLITRLEEIAWLCNLRGRDVEKTPVFFAFALLSRTQDRFYVMDPSFGGLAGRAENSVAEGAEQPLTSAGSHATACPDNAERAEEGILVLPYLQIFQDLEKLPGGKILLDETVVSYSLLQAIPQGVTVINDVDPAENRKAIKNPTEIASTRRAHVKDGVAMVEFLCWLKEAAWKTQVTELSAARYLDDCRRRQTGCYDLSFVTISGYMENGAIVHYDVTPETDKTLRREGFLLVDSGGQYEEGTTDITRTIVLGSLTQTMKEHYTLVMKSHIALATAKFTKGTTGAELDKIARKPLMEAGLNYNHGTGHGVGHLLSVHEGPCTISPRGGKSLILPGMILSDEPGVYLEGQYGIRLENEVLCVEEADGMLGFEPMTWCPWEREALLKEMLTAEEICWIDDYHRRVYQTLEAHLTEPQRTWLREATLPL